MLNIPHSNCTYIVSDFISTTNFNINKNYLDTLISWGVEEPVETPSEFDFLLILNFPPTDLQNWTILSSPTDERDGRWQLVLSGFDTIIKPFA